MCVAILPLKTSIFLDKVALSLLRSTPVKGRMSAKAKMFKAALNPDFLTRVLLGK